MPFFYVWRFIKGTGKLALAVPAIVTRAAEIFARGRGAADKREG